jgi:hypothetical protein
VDGWMNDSSSVVPPPPLVATRTPTRPCFSVSRGPLSPHHDDRPICHTLTHHHHGSHREDTAGLHARPATTVETPRLALPSDGGIFLEFCDPSASMCREERGGWVGVLLG